THRHVHRPSRPHRSRLNATTVLPLSPDSRTIASTVTTVDAVDFGLILDRAAGRRYPLGQQVVDELRRRVQAGSLGPGERLPPVRGLATALGVTPETVAGAYKRLVEEGYLRGEVGRGTFVAAPPLHAEEDPLAPFEAAGALPPFANPAAAPGPPAHRHLLRLASRPGVVSFAASVAAPR